MDASRNRVRTIRAAGLAVMAMIVSLAHSAYALPPGFNGNEVNDVWPTDPAYCSAWLAYVHLQGLEYYGCDYAHNALRNSGLHPPTNSCNWSNWGFPSHRSPYTTRPSPPSGSVTRGPSVEITFDVPITPRDCDPYSAWFDVDGVIVKANMTKGPLHHRLSYTLEGPLAYHGSPAWPTTENPVGGDLVRIRPYTYHHVKAYLTYSWNSYNGAARFVGETEFFHAAEWVRVQGEEVIVYNDLDADYEYDENQNENLVTVNPDRVTVGNTVIAAGFVAVNDDGECARILADGNPDDSSAGSPVLVACQTSQDGCTEVRHGELQANPEVDVYETPFPLLAVGTHFVRVCK